MVRHGDYTLKLFTSTSDIYYDLPGLRNPTQCCDHLVPARTASPAFAPTLTLPPELLGAIFEDLRPTPMFPNTVRIAHRIRL